MVLFLRITWKHLSDAQIFPDQTLRIADICEFTLEARKFTKRCFDHPENLYLGNQKGICLTWLQFAPRRTLCIYNIVPNRSSGQDRVSSPDFLLSPSWQLNEKCKWECAIKMQAVNPNCKLRSCYFQANHKENNSLSLNIYISLLSLSLYIYIAAAKKYFMLENIYLTQKKTESVMKE